MFLLLTNTGVKNISIEIKINFKPQTFTNVKAQNIR